MTYSAKSHLKLVTFAWAFSWMAQASIDFETQLDAAERLRLSDREAVANQIFELKYRQTEASPEQRQRLAILMAHQDVLRGEIAEGLAQLEEVVTVSKSPDVRSRAHSLRAQIMHAQADYVSAFKELEASMRSLKSSTNLKVKFDVLEVAARLFVDAGEYNKALGYSSDALIIAQELGDPLRICIGWTGMSIILSQGTDFDSLTSSAQKAQGACEGQSDLLKAAAFSSWAYGEYKKNNFSEAERLAREASNKFNDIQYAPGRITSEIHLGIISLQQGKSENAFFRLHSALEQARQYGMLSEVVDALTALAETATKEKKWQLAVSYYGQLRSAELKSLGEKKLIRSALLQVQFDSKHQEHQIELLEREKLLLEERGRAQSEKRRLLQFGVGAVSIICILLMLALHRLRNQSLQLRKLAQIDGLTGLHNRRHALMLAEQLYASCLRRNSPLAVVMVDLDLFKEINDRFGHAAGDEVLRNAARHFASCLRKQDVIGRTGGEEFAIFLPDTDLNAAITVVERCRNGLGEVQEGEQRRRVTASFGIAVASNDRFTLDELLQQADKALYSAKANGRNQVAIARDLAFAASAYDEPASLI